MFQHRAVLLQILSNGSYHAEVLTDDHKPTLDRERKRIQENGGYIQYDAIPRVQGELAVTRAIGHHLNTQLKQLVIPVPDVSMRELDATSQAIVLGSDGLWDVMTPYDVAEFVLPRLTARIDDDGSRCQRADAVAKELVDEAWDRRSLDNIACVVVDLHALHADKYAHFVDVHQTALQPSTSDEATGSNATQDKGSACMTSPSLHAAEEMITAPMPSSPAWMRTKPLSTGQRVGRHGSYVLTDIMSVVRSRRHSADVSGLETHDSIWLHGQSHDAMDVPIAMVREQEEQLHAQIALLKGKLHDSDSEDSDMTYLRLGSAYEALGEWDKAVHYLGILARQQPDTNGPLHGRLGLLYQYMSEPAKAIEFHEKHLQIAEAASDFFSAAAASGAMASVLLSLGHEKRAEQFHDKSRKLMLLAQDAHALSVPLTSSGLIQAAWAAPDSFSYSKLSADAAVALAYKAAAQEHASSSWGSESESTAGQTDLDTTQQEQLTAQTQVSAEQTQWEDEDSAIGVVQVGTSEHHTMLVGSLISIPRLPALGSQYSPSDEHVHQYESIGSEETQYTDAVAGQPQQYRKIEGASDGEGDAASTIHAPAVRGSHSVSKRGARTDKEDRLKRSVWWEAGMHHGYVMRENIGMGKFGEVWKARQYGNQGGGTFVLKRLFVEKGHEVHLSGLREVYFGKKLRGVPQVCRFVESFEEVMAETGQKNLWLVFYHEGLSLRHYLYEGTVQGTTVLYSPSKIWMNIRKSAAGVGTLRILMQQLLEGVSNCHTLNVTHRDIKPENILVHVKGFDEDAAGKPVLKLADFGSAVDDFSTRRLYGKRGPSVQDETLDYAPPEVLFGDVATAFSAMRPQSYDIWSVGVIFLELVLGTSKVFQVSERTRSLVDQRMRRSSAAVREQAYLFRAMVELCIYPPLPLDGHKSRDLVSIKCSDDQVQRILQQRDELGLAFPNLWAVKLLRRLLRWNAEARITADRALKHAFFREDGRGYPCARTDSEVEFEDEC